MLQIYEDTEEGRKVCTYYKLSYERKPVTLVIDPQTGQKVKGWEGMIDASRFLEVRQCFHVVRNHTHTRGCT